MRGCAYGLETVTTPGSTRATSPSVPPRGPMTGPGARRCARSAPSCDARTPASGSRSARGPRRGAGVGAPLVLRRTVSVGRAHRVGGRLLGPGAGDVRGARRRVAAGQRHAVDGGPGSPALGDRRRIPGGRLAVLRRRPPHLACGAVVRSRAYRALGAVAGRRYVRRPVRRYADGEAAAGVPRGG